MATNYLLLSILVMYILFFSLFSTLIFKQKLNILHLINFIISFAALYLLIYGYRENQKMIKEFIKCEEGYQTMPYSLDDQYTFKCIGLETQYIGIDTIIIFKDKQSIDTLLTSEY